MLAKVLLLAVIVLALGGFACADPVPPTAPDPISLDKWSPSVTAFGNTPSDIYGEGYGAIGGGWDVGGPGPILHVANWSYGTFAADETDAISLGDNGPSDHYSVYFSGSRRSRGMWNTQYRNQANRNQAAGDRFVTNGWIDLSPAQSYNIPAEGSLIIWTPGMGPNLLSANQTRYNEIPTIGPPVFNPNPDPAQIDDMDGLELHPIDLSGDHIHDLPLYFSLAPGSPTMPPGGSAADIFVSAPGSGLFSTWAAAASMGLAATDDIDALVVLNVSGGTTGPTPGIDYALFSLAPGNSLGISGSDILVTSFLGTSRVYLRGQTIGLLGRDNLDGLDLESRSLGSGFPEIWDGIAGGPSPMPTTISTGKANPDGSPANVHGIVTLIGPSYIYIEEPTRASGIRIEVGGPVPWYVSLGDDLQAIGVIGRFDGERVIFPTEMTEMSIGNPIPAPLDMRTRSVGGDDFDALNPGVTDGEGALNVGLRARAMGMVTAVDPSAIPTWFCIWDGANRESVPLNDGTGNLGVRVEYSMMAAPPVPWQDWVEVVGVVSTDARVVAGRVIPVMLPESAPEVITTFDQIQTCSLLAGWNLAALPVAPAGSSDGIEHSQKPWDPPVVFAGGDPNQIDSCMYRWENCSGGLYIWDIWMDDHVSGGAWGPFGGALLGDGYWIYSFFDVTYTYSGKRSEEDKWVSVCEPGWIILGYPKENGMLWEDVKVHDGAQILSLYDASQYGANWLNSMGYWWDASVQGLFDIGIPDDWPSTDDLRSCHGYWFEFYHGNKSLIFPGDPVLGFSQLDFNRSGGAIINDSEWGRVNMTFQGSGGVQYLNLMVNGSWQIQNMPVLSIEGANVSQTLSFCFDLGTTRGTEVNSLQYGYSLTDDAQATPPTDVHTASVKEETVKSREGLSAAVIPPLPFGHGVIGGVATGVLGSCHCKFPNQDCGVNECVPAAVSNSLMWLNNTYGLGLTAAQTSIGMMKHATDWTTAGCPVNWYDYKDAYMQANGYPISTKTVDPSEIEDEIDAGQDVELTGDWHCAAVTGAITLDDGRIVIFVTHDTAQGQAGGTITEAIIYDPSTGTLSGSPDFFDGSGVTSVVVECPTEVSL